MSKYYARNDEDREFDSTIKDAVKKSKSKTHMALYLQGQEELNLLREMIESQKNFETTMQDFNVLVKKIPELSEKQNEKISSEELYENILGELLKLNMKMNDLVQYICETEEKGYCSKRPEDYGIGEEAAALVRTKSVKAQTRFVNNPSVQNKRITLLWDYILCCVESCNEELQRSRKLQWL